MTHAELVKAAAVWLRKSQRCGVVLTEHGGGRELPDAIGWRSGFSRLVEVKVSRADFFADRKKPSRSSAADRPAWKCWYLTPPGLLAIVDLPEGWGLLEFDGERVRVIRQPPEGHECPRDPHALRDEVYRLYCEVRRYQIHGMKYPPLNPIRERIKAARQAARVQEATTVALATSERANTDQPATPEPGGPR